MGGDKNVVWEERPCLREERSGKGDAEGSNLNPKHQRHPPILSTHTHIRTHTRTPLLSFLMFQYRKKRWFTSVLSMTLSSLIRFICASIVASKPCTFSSRQSLPGALRTRDWTDGTD